MTKTAEIISAVESTNSDIDDAKTQASGAYEFAENLAQRAASHGWEGVANSMRSAVEALETLISSLGTAESATSEALGTLREINEQMSFAEVAEHYTAVVERLDQVKTAVGNADSSLDDARQAGEQAGSPGELMNMLQMISDSIDRTQRGIDGIKSAAEAERQEAANSGN